MFELLVCLLINSSILVGGIKLGQQDSPNLFPAWLTPLSEPALMHITMEELHITLEEALKLPKPPSLEMSLSALHGVPDNYRPKPYGSGFDVVTANMYDEAAKVMQEAKAAAAFSSKIEQPVGIKGLPPPPPKSMVVPPASVPLAAAPSKPVSHAKRPPVLLNQEEELPAHYQSTVYIVLHSILYLFFIPLACFGLARGKFYPADYLRIVSFYAGFFATLIITVKALDLPPWAAIPLSCFGALLATNWGLVRLGDVLPMFHDYENYTCGWIICCSMFAVFVANLIYQFVGSFLPDGHGIYNVVAENVLLAGAIYIAALILLGNCIIFLLRSDLIGVQLTQNIVMSLSSTCIIISGLAFVFNAIGIYAGSASNFVPLDPLSFFTVAPVLEYNGWTNAFILLLAFLWMLGVQLHYMHTDGIQQDMRKIPPNGPRLYEMFE